MNDLKVVEAGLCNIDALVSGTVNCGLTVQDNGDIPSSDVMKVAENVKEAQSAQDPHKLALT